MADSRGFRPFQLVRDAARNSPWVMIAVALHLIVIAGAAIFYTATHGTEKAEVWQKVTPTPRRAVEAPLEVPEEPVVRRALPVNQETELTAVDWEFKPTDVDVPEDLTQEVGDPESIENLPQGSSTAIGAGRGPGKHSSKPSAFSTRGDGPGGGQHGRRPKYQPELINESVLAGMRWLVRHQNEDGSWSPATLAQVCPCDHPSYNPRRAYDHNYDTGLTGMALLCFLGAGYSHESKQYLVDPVAAKRYRVGDVVKKGLQWLVKNQNADGSFSKDRPYLYNEALACMAVTEAYGLTQARFWREPAQKALDFLQAAQRPSPLGAGRWGWRYASRQEVEQFHRGAGSQDAELQKELYDADLSVTGWCVMALKSGILSGLKVDRESMDGGVAFANFVTQLGPDGKPTGLAGYLDAKAAGAKVTGPHDEYAYHPGSMSALGMCIRIFSQHDQGDPFLRAAADQIVKDLPQITKDKLSIDYYYWYYASLALNQIDGPDAPKKSNRYWPPWNKAMVDAVLALQDRTERACTHGGWMDLDRWSPDHGGPLYATAINVLTLEVYYRYPNAFGGTKRD